MWDGVVALGPAASRLNICLAFPVQGSPRVDDALLRIKALLSLFDIFSVAFSVEGVTQTFRGEVVVPVHVGETPPDRVLAESAFLTDARDEQYRVA